MHISPHQRKWRATYVIISFHTILKLVVFVHIIQFNFTGTLFFNFGDCDVIWRTILWINTGFNTGLMLLSVV